MIQAVMVVNNQGKPRLVRFYQHLPVDKQQAIINSTYRTVSLRDDAQCCCFADADEHFGKGHKIVYRHFATLYFIFIIDDAESELGMLDLVQVFVEVLDSAFENVCELDLIFNYDRVNFILDELVMSGMVVETSVDSIVTALAGAKKAETEETRWFG